MTRVSWWLVDRLSDLLEPAEAEAVRGDLAESGESGQQALQNVLGLVFRRQADLWTDWQPWLALVGLVVPVGILVGRFSSGVLVMWLGWASRQVMTIWGQGVRYETGMTVTDDIVRFVCGSLLLISWAWISGFVLGSLLRRAAWVYAVLFCLLWLVGRDVPRLFFLVPLHVALFWLIVQTVLILVPCLWGVRRGIHLGGLGVSRAMMLAVVITALTLVVQIEADREQLALMVWRNAGDLDGRLVWTPRMLPFVVIIWQFGFMFAATRWRRLLNREMSPGA